MRLISLQRTLENHLGARRECRLVAVADGRAKRVVERRGRARRGRRQRWGSRLEARRLGALLVGGHSGLEQAGERGGQRGEARGLWSWLTPVMVTPVSESTKRAQSLYGRAP